MIKSMTGYGRGVYSSEMLDIQVEVRSVNHRYMELNVRLPHTYSALEERLKKLVQQKANRGKTEISVSLQFHGTADTKVEINAELAETYINAMREQNSRFQLQDDLTLTTILQLPDIFTVRKTPMDEEELWTLIEPVAQEAIERFVNMRTAEGEQMLTDISGRLNTIEQMTQQVEAQSPETAKRYYDRLYKKLSELLEGRDIDTARLVTEAAIFSEKIAVDEETVRLHSHIAQFRSLLTSGEPVGRKLDFLIQEMNREVNTIGSKAQDLQITRLVVDMKAEIEKIREQIQNIE